MTIPPLSLGLSKGVERAKLIDSELFEFGQAHGHLCKSGAHTLVHALAGRLQAGPAGNLELTVPASLIKGVFDALDEPGAEFVVRNNRTESAIKVMTKEEVDKLGGINHITERGHSYHYTLGPIVELPASGEYDKLWAISIKSEDLEDIRKSYGLETSPQLGFFIPVGCKKKHVTKENNVSKLASLLSPNKNWNPPAYHKISPADDSFNKTAQQPIIPSRVGVGSPYYDPKNVLGTQPPSNFNFSNTSTPTQKSYNRPSFPTYQPGPNYERGDERRNAWPGKPGWADDRYKPLPEEAPLQGATSDLSFTTPLAGYSLTRGAYGGLKSLANLPKAVDTAYKNLPNMPSASKLFNTFSGSSGGASIGNLWKALNLKGLVKNPYAKYGLPAAGAGYAVGPAAVESAKSVPSALNSVNLYPNWMRNLSNVNETPFSITTGDRASLEQAGLFGLDAAKQSLGHMAYKGLNSFSDSSNLPYNPLAYLPNSQASRSITKTLAGKAAPFLEQYSQPPDYEKLYTSYLANRHGIQEGDMAGKVSIPGLPSFSLNKLSPYLSQGYKDVVNSALVPSPVKVTANPQYLKEVMSKTTPNIGEAIYDSMFKSKNNAADETNFYKRLQEINSKPVSFTDIGRKYNTPGVQTHEPQLRQSMSNMAKIVGNTISDKLIPPRPLGQKAPTMFPQISKYIDRLPWK